MAYVVTGLIFTCTTTQYDAIEESFINTFENATKLRTNEVVKHNYQSGRYTICIVQIGVKHYSKFHKKLEPSWSCI